MNEQWYSVLERIGYILIGVLLTRGVTSIIHVTDKKRVYNWLRENTKDIDGERFKSTNSVSNGVNLIPARVVRACYSSNKIRRSTSQRESWTIYLNGAEDDAPGILII